MSAYRLNVPTRRGSVLNGVLFRNDDVKADTVMIAITGIHGNFYSNPFYYDFGETLNAAGIDFIYAQTNDAFNRIETFNAKTNQPEIIGSFNERFSYTDEDIEAYLNLAHDEGYTKIILAGHSLGANKVIYYLSRHHDTDKVSRFLLLSPANIEWLLNGVTQREKDTVREMCETGRGNDMLPFQLMGWVPCIADTAYDWIFSGLLDNVHVEADKDFSQVSNITHTGGLLIGTYDRFTYGDPAGFLTNINNHMSTAKYNKLIFIEGTGHTYQRKEKETAKRI
ncbi:MAG: DUF1749 domain-containing protein, partial [Synergistaceae bacterium]|nr:DUF1749 domain-containing protein [Synergistaceae bacterium]